VIIRPPLPAALVIDEHPETFISANGQALAYVYFEEEPGRRSAAHPNDHHDALTSYRVGGIPWVLSSNGPRSDVPEQAS